MAEWYFFGLQLLYNNTIWIAFFGLN